MSQTEFELKSWRYGQTQAERLAAALLRLEGYSDVDPQHPLGGPDGGKDILCRRERRKHVGAVYFPSTEPSEKELKDKFKADYAGVAKNSASGFVFFVNQYLPLSLRGLLMNSAEPEHAVEIYHLERIIGLLDSPAGCGLRLEYLRIPMSESEQWAFWSHQNSAVLRRITEVYDFHDARLEALERKLDVAVARTAAISTDLTTIASSLRSAEFSGAITTFGAPTATLTVPVICWIHSVIMAGSNVPISAQGALRTMNVWIEAGSGSPSYTPPEPLRAAEGLEALVAKWVSDYPGLATQEASGTIRALAQFHHKFLALHPFMDGNGRVARAIIDQAAQELLGRHVSQAFASDVPGYIGALRAGDDGDLSSLEVLIRAALE